MPAGRKDKFITINESNSLGGGASTVIRKDSKAGDMYRAEHRKWEQNDAAFPPPPKDLNHLGNEMQRRTNDHLAAQDVAKTIKTGQGDPARGSYGNSPYGKPQHIQVTPGKWTTKDK